jgi:TRAP-type C4-dicarboxylate transport system permease small subunit
MRRILDNALVAILVVLMSIMVISTLLQVFARFISLNVQFTEELTIYAMMWVTLFGSAYVFGLRKHIAIDLLSESIGKGNQWKLVVLTEIIISLFALLVFLTGGIHFVYLTFKLGQVSSVIQVPKGWIYLAIPMSGVIILIYNFLNIRDALKMRTP